MLVFILPQRCLAQREKENRWKWAFTVLLFSHLFNSWFCLTILRKPKHVERDIIQSKNTASSSSWSYHLSSDPFFSYLYSLWCCFKDHKPGMERDRDTQSSYTSDLVGDGGRSSLLQSTHLNPGPWVYWCCLCSISEVVEGCFWFRLLFEKRWEANQFSHSQLSVGVVFLAGVIDVPQTSLVSPAEAVKLAVSLLLLWVQRICFHSILVLLSTVGILRSSNWLCLQYARQDKASWYSSPWSWKDVELALKVRDLGTKVEVSLQTQHATSFECQWALSQVNTTESVKVSVKSQGKPSK